MFHRSYVHVNQFSFFDENRVLQKWVNVLRVLYKFQSGKKNIRTRVKQSLKIMWKCKIMWNLAMQNLLLKSCFGLFTL